MQILYATDGSEGALAAASLLAHLPLGQECQLRILTVGSHEEEAESQATLAAARQALVHSLVSITTEVRTGDPTEAILRATEEGPASLLVVGARGRSSIGRFFLGSVAERVVRHAACSVLLARPLRGELRTVIVGVDGSACATQAVVWLERFPLPDACEVRLVTVLPFQDDLIRARMLLPPHFTSYNDARAFAEQRPQEAQAHLDGLATSFAASHKRAITDVRRGDAALSLLQVAEDHGAQLIVVGSRGLSANERFALGSVSEKLARYAHGSVLVVKEAGGSS
jgi:nucleotide-binding universal stress UspA family protein